MTAVIPAAIVIIADRAVKHYAVHTLNALQGSKVLLSGLLRMIYTENRGIAFGLFTGSAPAVMVCAVLFLAVIAYALRRTRLTSFPKIALGLAAGGAAGNIIDRFLYGFVVDMFDFEFVRFAVFNLADAAIVTGAFMMAISILFMPGSWSRKA
jgi:signal peptidase II